MIIVCPSGLSGEIRGLTGKDLRALSGKAKGSEAIDRITSGAWLKTVEPGPYRLRADGSLDWDKMLVGDSDYILFRVRVATHGSLYPFDVRCKDTSCREMISWEIDLDRDLPIKPLSEDSRRLFQAGNCFETALPGTGARVVFKLPLREDARLAAVRKKQLKQQGKFIDNPAIEAIAARLLKVEGVSLRNHGEKIEFLESLDWGPVCDLLELFLEPDCQKTKVSGIVCPECELEQEHDLPFGEAFFFPKKRANPTTSTPTSPIPTASAS
jgi:hypothetical protein